jgi:hypothetical protein
MPFNNKNLPHSLILVFLFILILSACNCGKEKKKPNVSDIKIELTTYRFDREFQHLDTTKMQASMMMLEKKYDIYYDVYIHDIMKFGYRRDSSNFLAENIKGYLRNRDMKDLYDTVQQRFPSMDPFETELKKSFQFAKYYAPHVKLPSKLVTCIGGLNMGAFTIDTDYVSVGLDLFLGDQYVHYDVFPQYISAKFIKELMLPNTMKAIYNNNFGNPYMTSENLISTMIEVGKQQYFLEKALPDVSSEYLFAYSSDQLKWCEASEKSIWKYLADKDDFYKERDEDIRHYIGEQPSTPGMPPESPGNIGAWVGYKIVSAYMESMNNQPSMEQLIKTNPKEILAKSKYKP